MPSEKFLNSLRNLKTLGYNAVKRTAELIMLDRVWVDRAAEAQSVRDTIAKLTPHTFDGELIRLGSDGDGGYLVPDDFDGIVGCVSPGVAGEVGFDLQLAERGMKIVMADASVDGVPVDHENFVFHKKFLGTRTDDLFVRLEDLVANEFPEGDLILQMDIEGAEFPVLLDCSDEVLRRFRMIVLEIHDFGQVFGRFSNGLVDALADKLNRTHAVVHNHPNNCCGSHRKYGIEIPRVMELTFYRRDRGVSEGTPATAYPHPLDQDNVPSRSALVLPKIWQAR